MMSLKHVAVACCVLSSAGVVLAQSKPAPPDPLTGTWTGSMAPTGATNRQAVTVAFKLAPGGAVTGIITGPPKPGEIKTGSFDAKTGALKFDVTVRGEGTVARFEGTLVGSTATGRVLFDGQVGDFTFSKGEGVKLAVPLRAPALQIDQGTAAAARGFTEVSGWLMRAAELVPADKYSYRPVATVRTFAQLVGHIADSHNYYCARAAGKNVQWSDAIEKGSGDRATLVQKLKQSIESCGAAYGGSAQVGPLVENVGHDNLHYGNMITYIRMLGLVPPSS